MPQFDFTGKTAVVTGASTGIGREIALMLAASGAAVCLLGRSHQALESVRDNSPTPDRFGVYEADLRNPNQIPARRRSPVYPHGSGVRFGSLHVGKNTDSRGRRSWGIPRIFAHGFKRKQRSAMLAKAAGIERAACAGSEMALGVLGRMK